MNFTSLAEENAALKAQPARSQLELADHQAALAASEEARRRLEIIVEDLRRDKFGAKSERLTPDQYNLRLEDVEIAQGILDGAHEKAEAIIKGKSSRADRSRNVNPCDMRLTMKLTPRRTEASVDPIGLKIRRVPLYAAWITRLWGLLVERANGCTPKRPIKFSVEDLLIGSPVCKIEQYRPAQFRKFIMS
jgi:hypothetical protein